MISKKVFSILYVLMIIIVSTLIFGATTAESQDAQGKMLNARLMDRLEQGEATVDVIVLLTGYKGYSGQIRADYPVGMAVKQAKIKNHQNAILNRVCL